MTVLQITRGDRNVFDLALTGADGTALDLTDLTIAFTAKRRLRDADDDAVLAKTTANGIAIVSAIGGTATLTLEGEDTTDLEGPLYWDVQVDDLAGDIRTPLRGKLVIVHDVTRSASVGS